MKRVSVAQIALKSHNDAKRCVRHGHQVLGRRITRCPELGGTVGHRAVCHACASKVTYVPSVVTKIPVGTIERFQALDCWMFVGLPSQLFDQPLLPRNRLTLVGLDTIA